MNKTTTYGLLIVAVTIGVVLGYGGAALLGSRGAGKIHNAQLAVGDEAPDFKLRDHTGRTIRLNDYVGEHNVVLAFFPGAFTPV